MENNDLYKLNLAALTARFGNELGEALEAVAARQRVEVVTGSAGWPTFSYRLDDNRKVFFHSMYNPQKEAYQLIQQKNYSDVSVVFVLGIGFAYHVELLRKEHTFYGTIFIIEPSLEILKSAMEARDLREIFNDPRIQLLVEPDIALLKEAIYSNSIFKYVSKCEIICPPVYQKVFSAYLSEVLAAISLKATRRLCDFVAVDELSGNWERNSLINLPSFFKSVPIPAFFDAFKGVPCIIVAAGPSLDKNIDQLKAWKSRAVIISMGTSLRPLIQKGIKPDFVIALDASDVVHAQFEGIDDIKDIWLLAEISLSPKLVSKFYPAVSFFYSMHNPFLAYLLRKKRFEDSFIESGGSVANSALDFARKAGCNPIIFVAQDLCLEGARSHAKGTMHEDERYVPEGFSYVTVPGNYEKEVNTFRSFLTFLRWTENYIRKYPSIEFINATAGGARIEGTKLETLENMLKRPTPSDFDFNALMDRLKTRASRGCGKDGMAKIKSALPKLRLLDKKLRQGMVLVKQAGQVIRGEKILSEKAKKRSTAKLQAFFTSLNEAKFLDLLSSQTRNEIMLMLKSAETNRVGVKGSNEVMLLMPELLQKLLTSSKQVKKGLRNIIRHEDT